MSHVEAGPLGGYNALTDPYLAGYFANTRIRRHLRKSGLVSKRGEVVSENTYRLSMAKKEHKKHVRDLLAQAIVHKTLDMERNRQVQIKRKLEEIAKIELVRRVRAERGRKGDEEILPYLAPPPGGKGRGRPSSVPAGKTRRRTRPGSAPAKPRPVSASAAGYSQATDSHGMRPIYIDAGGYPVAPANKENTESSPETSARKYPKGEIDTRNLYALDQTALREYTLAMNGLDKGHGPSPYSIPQISVDQMPTPPKGSPHSGASRRGRRRIQPTDSQGRPVRGRPKNSSGLHRSEPAMSHLAQLQSMCDITLHYFGPNIHLDYERFDPRDDITVQQQHCGGNTLDVFRDKVMPGSDISFKSHRHRGYPFSVTIYINGVQDIRISTCCEYKHTAGAKLGGRLGHFGLVSVEGAAPCYRCQIEKQQKEKEQQKKKGDKKKSAAEVEVDEDEEDVVEEKPKEEEVDVKGEGDEEDKYDDKPLEVTVQLEEDEKEESEAYDDDFENSDDEKSPEVEVEPEKTKEKDSGKDKDDEYSVEDEFEDADSIKEKTDTSRTDEVASSEDEAVKETPRSRSSRGSISSRSSSSSRSSKDSPRSDIQKKPEKSPDKPVVEIEIDENGNGEVDQPDAKGERETPEREDSHRSDSSESESEAKKSKKKSSGSDSSDSENETKKSKKKKKSARSYSSGSEDENKKSKRKSSHSSSSDSEDEGKKVNKKSSGPDAIGSGDDSKLEQSEPKSADSGDEKKTEPETEVKSPKSNSSESKADIPRLEARIDSADNIEKEEKHTVVDVDDSDNEEPVTLAPSAGVLKASQQEKSDAEEESKEAAPGDPKEAVEEEREVDPDHKDDSVEPETPKPSSDDSEKEQVVNEMEKVLTEEKASPQEDSSSSSSSSSSESEDEEEKPKPAETTNNEPSTTAEETATETDAGGNDPDNVAGDGSPRPTQLNTQDIQRGAKHDGSIRPLVEGKTEVDLTNISLSSAQVHELSQILKADDSVESLILRNGGVSDDGVHALAHALSQTTADLKMLNLNCNEITSKGVESICEILKAKTDNEILLVHGNPLGNEGIATLVDCLIDIHKSGANRLHVQADTPRSTSEEEEVPPEKMEQINEVAKDMVLNIIEDALRTGSETSLHEAEAAAAKDGQPGKPSKPAPSGLRLKQLDLGDCQVSDTGAEDIAKLIVADTPIETLNLTGNKDITPDGWTAIAEAIALNTHLTTVSLDYNKLRDAGVEAIAEGLTRNKSVRSLDLEGNQITEKGGKIILSVVTSNTTLKDITLMPGNFINEDTRSEIKDLMMSRTVRI